MISCQTCFYAEQQGGQLVCCRFPPTPAMLPTRNPITGQPEPAIIAMRPTTQTGWYCGEYSSDSEAESKGKASPIEGGLQ